MDEKAKMTTINKIAGPQRLRKAFNLDMYGFYPKRVLVKHIRQ